MLTIKRTCTNKIITRALASDSKPLLAILLPDADDCIPCTDIQHMNELLDQNPKAIIVYNQHPQTSQLIDQLQISAAQIFIEIRQDTKGVLGLQALRKQDGRAETLELVYL
ncbi:MAG: hypothetical protein E2O57_05360 [Gammaproteobacteria bacterium]|nr:MAG: hypothetical protein E2O57_05360 [Gammaproteobacteria bacterium]